jgi:hypothetical protein
MRSIHLTAACLALLAAATPALSEPYSQAVRSTKVYRIAPAASGTFATVMLQAQGRAKTLVTVSFAAASGAAVLQRGSCRAAGPLRFKLNAFVSGRSATLVPMSIWKLTDGGWTVDLGGGACGGIVRAARTG